MLQKSYWSFLNHYPAEFFPLAEEYGMITTFTKWILETVVDDCHVWKQKRYENFAVSINLSAKTLLANAIIPLLDEIIAF